MKLYLRLLVAVLVVLGVVAKAAGKKNEKSPALRRKLPVAAGAAPTAWYQIQWFSDSSCLTQIALNWIVAGECVQTYSGGAATGAFITTTYATLADGTVTVSRQSYSDSTCTTATGNSVVQTPPTFDTCTLSYGAYMKTNKPVYTNPFPLSQSQALIAQYGYRSLSDCQNQSPVTSFNAQIAGACLPNGGPTPSSIIITGTSLSATYTNFAGTVCTGSATSQTTMTYSSDSTCHLSQYTSSDNTELYTSSVTILGSGPNPPPPPYTAQVGACPAGSFVSTTTGTIITGTITNSAVFTFASALGGISVGNTVSGTGIAAGTTVVAIAGWGTSVTLSSSPTVDLTAGNVLTFTSCMPCLSNTYSAAGATTCTQCPLGFFSLVGASPCTSSSACAAGLVPGTKTLTAATTSGSSTITVTSSTGVVVGATVSGTGVAPGTTVTAIAPTTLTLSSAATATSNSASLTCSACVSCPTGQYAPSGATACMCAGGYAGSGATSCTLCPSGKFSVPQTSVVTTTCGGIGPILNTPQVSVATNALAAVATDAFSNIYLVLDSGPVYYCSPGLASCSVAYHSDASTSPILANIDGAALDSNNVLFLVDNAIVYKCGSRTLMCTSAFSLSTSGMETATANMYLSGIAFNAAYDKVYLNNQYDQTDGNSYAIECSYTLATSTIGTCSKLSMTAVRSAGYTLGTINSLRFYLGNLCAVTSKGQVFYCASPTQCSRYTFTSAGTPIAWSTVVATDLAVDPLLTNVIYISDSFNKMVWTCTSDSLTSFACSPLIIKPYPTGSAGSSTAAGFSPQFMAIGSGLRTLYVPDAGPKFSVAGTATPPYGPYVYSIALPTSAPMPKMAPATGAGDLSYAILHDGAGCASGPSSLVVDNFQLNVCKQETIASGGNTNTYAVYTCKAGSMKNTVQKLTYAPTDTVCSNKLSTSTMSHVKKCDRNPQGPGYFEYGCGPLPGKITGRAQILLKSYRQYGSAAPQCLPTNVVTRSYMVNTKDCAPHSTVGTNKIAYYQRLTYVSTSANGVITLSEQRYALSDKRCQAAPIASNVVTYAANSGCAFDPLDRTLAYARAIYYPGGTASWSSTNPNTLTPDSFIRAQY